MDVTGHMVYLLDRRRRKIKPSSAIL